MFRIGAGLFVQIVLTMAFQYRFRTIFSKQLVTLPSN